MADLCNHCDVGGICFLLGEPKIRAKQVGGSWTEELISKLSSPEISESNFDV